MTDENVHHGFTNGIVKAFLYSNLSLILIVLSGALGIAALLITPREEDPQIVVPLADIYVEVPGQSAAEVERLVATPLEKLLYQIDGVEYVYSMSKPGRAIITVRFYVGEDRERSLVKIYKRIDENVDIVPAGVTGWVVKPVEIDDVPIVTLTLASATTDSGTLCRVAEEVVERLAATEDTSRAYVVGGEARRVTVYLNANRMEAHQVTPASIRAALAMGNVTRTAGAFSRNDEVHAVEIGERFRTVGELRDLVVGVYSDRPVFLKDVAEIVDGPAEATSYVRHAWGPGRGFEHEPTFAGSLLGPAAPDTDATSSPAVTIAVAKKKGSNAVRVAEAVLAAAAELKRTVVPDDIEMVVTRNVGLTANHKVNELIEALAVAVFIVIALLSLSLGWREALIVAVAVPVVFGLTLTVNLLFGYTINRVTLFALILALGLLVDDPIVDVENITRHFRLRRRASREIVLEAVAEIRPPLITATLAVIVSFLPLLFITGMMGPYMSPMALNVPVTMLMSMLVAFTITPWMAYHVLKRTYRAGAAPGAGGHDDEHGDHDDLKSTRLYRLFYPLMAPLLSSKRRAWVFLFAMLALTALAAGLAATRDVPLKMLPFDNKNELLLLVDLDEGTTLERTDAAVRDLEAFLTGVPEIVDVTSYVGLASPMDFNGMVRHYYLRRGENVAELRLNLVGKKSRRQQSHALGLRLRDDLQSIAAGHNAVLSLVELPPGPPVLASVVAEVYGEPHHSYEELLDAAALVQNRLSVEPGVVDVDSIREAGQTKLVFETDKEKAALNGVSTADVAEALAIGLGGVVAGNLQTEYDRQPLPIELRLPRSQRSDEAALAQVHVAGRDGELVPLSELGAWRKRRVDQTVYHKNLRRVAYVFAETAGRPPADVVVDVQADRLGDDTPAVAYDLTAENAVQIGPNWMLKTEPKPVGSRTFLRNGSGIHWAVGEGIDVDFAGEGEWKITLDVFRDLGLAFAAAMVAIYILLVAQTGSFVVPMVVMLAIPLTVLGIMPGFWLLNALSGGQVGGYADPIFFTATGMIGMIALAGIVTRDSIILVDFIHISLRRGRTLFEAIMESRIVRLRPILLTAGTAMLSAAPITIDPIFSGLAWSLIFGLFASTVFTLFVIPVTYWLLYADKPGHGLPDVSD